MAGVLFLDTDDSHPVRAAFRRQVEIDDLRILLLQQRHKDLIQRNAKDGRLIRRLAGVSTVVNRVFTHRDAVDRKNREFCLLVVVTGVVAIRAFERHFIGMNHPFQHNFGRGRHLQGRADALDQFGLAAAQQAGKLVFGERIRYRRHRTENGRRIAAEHDRHRERLAGIGQLVIAKIQRPAAMRQPAHDQLVRAQHLLAINTEILPSLVRPLGNDQAPGNQRRDVARPAMLDRQARQIDVLAFPNDVLTGRARYGFRRHVEHLLQNRQLVPGVLQAFRRLRLLEVGEQFTNFTQRLHRLLAHTERHPLRRTEQVGEHRNRVASLARFGLLEQNGRPFGAQHAVADFGHFEVRIYFETDALQFAGLFQLRHEVA